MKTRKAIIYSLIIPTTVGQLILFLFFRKESAEIRTYYSYSILLASLFGLVVTLIILAFVKDPRGKSWSYAAGQVLAFGFLLTIFLKKNSSGENRKEMPEDTGGNVYNPDSLYNWGNPVDLAMSQLKSKFDTSEKIRLTFLDVKPRDTLVSGKSTHSYAVYLIYDTSEKDSLYSKVIVFKDSCYFEKLNADARTEEELLPEWSRELNKSIKNKK